MKLYLRISWRNIWRNTRRTAITVGALGFSAALLLFFIALMDDYVEQMEENMIGMSLGHVQVHHPNYLADQNLYQVIENASELVQSIRDAGYEAAPRVFGYGLVAADRSGKSAGARLRGIDLELEPTVTTMNRESNFLEGRFLDGAHRTVTPEPATEAAEEPAFNDPLAEYTEESFSAEPRELVVGQVVLGKKLAADLDVHPGDTISVVTMAANGTMGNELLDVVGVLKNFSEMEDRSMALVTREDYQRLLHLPKDEVHEIAIRLPEGADLDLATAHIQKLVGDAGEAKSWREIQPAMAEMMDFQRTGTLIFGLTIYVGAAMLVMNSMLMMVFERIREFGVMKAIGLKGWQIVVLIYLETIWLCLLGACAGLLLGLPCTYWVQRVGIDLSAWAPEGFAVSGTVLNPVLHATITPYAIIAPIVSLVAVAFVSVLYPAVKAAVIEPVKALTHV